MTEHDENPWRTFLTDIEPTEHVSDGNKLTHLSDDDHAVRAIWRSIEEACDRVWMTMYILAPDSLGLGTIERLTDAARRGCDVRLIYDYLGSIRLEDRHLAALRAAGGHHAPFNRFWPPWKRNGPLRIRNHRKLILVDTEAAVCGGMNLSEEYCSELGDEWIFDDTVVLVEGPAVLDLMSIFCRTWKELTGEEVDLPPRPNPVDGGAQVQVLETDPRRPETRLRDMLDGAISRAHERCYIATPYFMPEDWLIDSLLDAVQRGADVRVVTAGRIDLVPARAAARHTYGRLLEEGVHIYEMFGRILHSKIVAIDGAFGTIGSYNLDRWTARHTLDTSVAIVDARLARSLEREFEAYMNEASEFTLADYQKRGVPTRALHWIASTMVDAL